MKFSTLPEITKTTCSISYNVLDEVLKTSTSPLINAILLRGTKQ